MHCIRRVALRAASAQTARTAIVTKRAAPVLTAISATAVRSAAVPIARAFSVSRALAEAEENSGNSTVQDSKLQEEAAEGQGNTRSPDPPNGLFVRNLVFDATEELLVEAFSEHGKVTKAQIARDARGLSRGYGFVYFETAEEAQNAVERANGTFWHGRRINCAPRTKSAASMGRQRSFEERTPTEHLYIGNIPYETTDAELNKLFQSLDGLKDVRIAVDRSTGWPRGFAHADFKDVESATKAAHHLKSIQLTGRSLRVDYSAPAKQFSRRSRNE